jgi:peptide/nickel transport system ATP-binding protein
LVDPVVDAQELRKYFDVKLGFMKSLRKGQVLSIRAVDGVSFQIASNEIFGLVGESGCGKTTTGKMLVRLLEPTGGKVLFCGTDITALREREMRGIRKRIQMIFQDPYESLNPRMSIYDIVAEPIENQKMAETPEELLDLVSKALEDLDLSPPEEYLYRFPHELSGGQRQRVAIARAFVVSPKFIVADEPTSMLDASIRAEVLKLVLGLIEKTECAFLYITHDIALSRYLCNRIGVMYLGRIVEIGPTDAIVSKRFHPYTQALLAAVPLPDPTARRARVTIPEEVTASLGVTQGCSFRSRCKYAMEICLKDQPILKEVGKSHSVSCHLYD